MTTASAGISSNASPLQVLARRCPVMSKAMAVQSARMATGSVRGSKARLHTSGFQCASVAEVPKSDPHGRIDLYI